MATPKLLRCRAPPSSVKVKAMRTPRAPSTKNVSESDLHAAARSGDLQKVESICTSNPLAVNFRDKHSRTPLHLAAWSGQTEIVGCLCKHKADVGAAAMDDTAAIHFASQKGHLQVVRTLVSAGVSVKATNRKGLTPLHYAVQGSHLELIRYLVRKGANLGAKTKSGQTPMDLANSEEVVSFLAECEQSLKKMEESTTSKKAGDSDPKEPVKGEDIGSGAKEEASDVGEKRKGEETADDSVAGPKKARVSLQHLVAEDYEEDGEEE